MTGFQYIDVGVVGVGDRKKKNKRKKRVGFSVSFFGGNRKTDFTKNEKNRPKKTTFGFRLTTNDDTFLLVI